MENTRTMLVSEYCASHSQVTASRQTGVSQPAISLTLRGLRPDFYVVVGHDGKTILDAYRFKQMGHFKRDDS